MRDHYNGPVPPPWDEEPPPEAQPLEHQRPVAPADTTHSSWHPIDISDVLDGTFEPEIPALMPRTDGPGLLYRGRVHSFHGESESGKSMVLQAEAARILIHDGSVAYLDFESDAETVVTRLLAMGTPADAIRKKFAYLRPETNPTTNTDVLAWTSLLNQRWDLAVIDGVTEALAVTGGAGSGGFSSKDNDALTSWIRQFPRRLAHTSGAAVVLVDHVVKDGDSRGRYAIGGQAKLAALDGAAYVVEVIQPLGVGLHGVIALRVAKDRPGRIRPHAGPWRRGDRTAEIARVHVDSTTEGQIRVRVEAPSTTLVADGAPAGTFRPTVLMEKVSREVEVHPDPLTFNDISKLVTGNRKALQTAVTVLVEEQHLSAVPGPRRSTLHHALRPYRQQDDPLSDRFREPEPVEGLEGG